MHVVLALGSWLALMMIGYALNPQGVPQIMILLLSILVPLVVGFLVTRLRQDELAPLVWLIGLIWILIVSLWVLDMPTGPNQCFQCDATEKLTRTFFSLPRPSGLIDNDGPFLGTWPAAALIGYAIGARLALRRRPPVE
jgi:energy-coupling factor transporter transmembrane protein EcfT